MLSPSALLRLRGRELHVVTLGALECLSVVGDGAVSTTGPSSPIVPIPFMSCPVTPPAAVLETPRTESPTAHRDHTMA